MWKLINDYAPNITDNNGCIRSYEHIRRGKHCVVSKFNYEAPAYAQTFKERSFAVHGPRLFNGILKEPRGYSGEPEGFKLKLDKCLATLPDEPALSHCS